MPDTTQADNKLLIEKFFEVVVNQRQVAKMSQFIAGEEIADGGGTCGPKIMANLRFDPDPLRVVGAKEASRLIPETARPRGAKAMPELDAWRDVTRHVLKAFPDMKVKIDSIVAEGETVVVKWTATGTHKEEFLGVAPTGRKVPMTNVDIFTVKDGKIVGVTAHPDAAAVLNALGHVADTPVSRALGVQAEK